MKKIFRLSFLLLAVLILPSLCQASVTILTNSNPNHTIASGSNEKVYGTSASNQITLEIGASAELINFPGQNSIQIQSSSDLFTVSRSGTILTFQGSDGTVLKIPATKDAQTISFDGEESRVLLINNNQVMLDDQVVTLVPSPIEIPTPILSVTPAIQNVESDSGTTTFLVFNIGTGTMNWTAEVTSGNDWLSITSGSSGSDSGTIICQHEVNTETNRTATIQVTYTTMGSPVSATVIVEQRGNSPIAEGCGAYITHDVWKEFDCYNLAAIGKMTNDDPFTPSWSLIGGYWQWGWKGPSSEQWYTINTSNFAHGPTGPGEDEANITELSVWNQIYAPDGAWSDEFTTANDPCPSGFRVPTQSQWQGVVDNNFQYTVGSWDSLDNTNYSSAKFFGDRLMLPAAGFRNNIGVFYYRGYSGRYWSSTKLSSGGARYLSGVDPGEAGATTRGSRLDGYSVRCIAE